MQAASAVGVKTFGYLFTQPQPFGIFSDPSSGGLSKFTSIYYLCPDNLIKVKHGAELFFVYGAPPEQSASAKNLSKIMIDYWVSFATSLDPNDGLGNPRKCLID